MLLSQDADSNIQDKNKKTPLDYDKKNAIRKFLLLDLIHRQIIYDPKNTSCSRELLFAIFDQYAPDVCLETSSSSLDV